MRKKTAFVIEDAHAILINIANNTKIFHSFF